MTPPPPPTSLTERSDAGTNPDAGANGAPSANRAPGTDDALVPPVVPVAVEIADGPAEAARAGGARGGAVVLVGMLLVALNLRTAVTSLGALLDDVRTGLHLSGAEAGLATTLPTIAFAGIGALTPWLVRRFAPSWVLIVAMLALVVGQVLRASTGASSIFLLTSALALAGVAVGNVLLPMLVKQHFPARAGLVTGAYSMTLTAGTALAAATAVPIARAFDSWRAGLGVWAILAAFAVLPLLPGALRRASAGGARGAGARTAAVERVRPARTRLGWAMALYFGTQSLSGYAVMGWLAQLFRDAGYTPQGAGLLLSGVTALGIPIALLMPALAARLRTLRPLVFVLTAASTISYVGLVVSPHGGALLWVALLAIGQGAFPLVLATIGLRARTPEGTVALSGFAQSTGYVIAALGPLLVGLLYESTGGWTLPITFLLVALVGQTIAGLAIARPRFVEDER